MDEFSSRKAAGGLPFSRKASSRPGFRDSVVNRDQNTQPCSRVGCSSRMNFTKGNQIGSSSKAKITRHPFCLSTSGKEVIGSSSRTPVPLSGPRKSSSDPRKKIPCHQVEGTESSSFSKESEASELVIKPDSAQIRLNTPVKNSMPGEASSSSSIPHSRNGKKTMRWSELGMDDSSIGTSASQAFKQSNHGVRHGASTSKYDFKNFKCNSVNDVAPSGCSSSSTTLATASSSELNLDEKRVMGRKRIGEAEGSLHTRGKKMNGTRVDGRRNDNAHRGISISNSRRTRDSNFTRENTAMSVGTQRSTARVRLSEQEDRNRLRPESSSSMPLFPHPGMRVDTNALSSEYQFSSQGSSSRRNASGRPGSTRANISSNRSFAPFDVGFGSSFTNRDNVSQYSLDGIAEVSLPTPVNSTCWGTQGNGMLLALDRIEQDEELTYERLLVLETNLFLSGLSFHDQHRDLRLDIDNMSYEELLALEERMGAVSTALPEEALSKCLNKSIYRATTTEERSEGGEGDEIKCSICQEEYKEGNEVGRLGCEHLYHVDCIQQWLRLKKWCPICKASAAPSPSASPSRSLLVS